MAEMDPAHRVYQAPGVYTTPDSQQVHILYGGSNPGNPQPGDGHGHLIYNIPQDRIIKDRPPA